MNQSSPGFMERVLEILLPSRDRATIAGDLYEEFREVKVPQLGPTRAKFWYLRQVVSFIPRRLQSSLSHPHMLALICAFTALCGAWLGIMDVRLHHPAAQLVIAGIIVTQGILTLSSLHFKDQSVLRYLAMLGCLGLFWLDAKVLLGLLRRADLEGYVLVIALALLIQGVLTLGTLPPKVRLAS